MADWYYASGGQQIGPIAESVLRQMIATGQVRSADMVWTEGMSEWVAAGVAFGPPPQPIAPVMPPPQPMQPMHTMQPMQPMQPGMGMQRPPGQAAGGNITTVIVGGAVPGAAPMGVRPDLLPKGMAVASMVLGIISLAMFCAWYLAMPCAIIAIALGGVATARANRGQAGGKSMATAGIVCGVISLAIDIIIAATVGAIISSMFR